MASRFYFSTYFKSAAVISVGQFSKKHFRGRYIFHKIELCKTIIAWDFPSMLTSLFYLLSD